MCSYRYGETYNLIFSLAEGSDLPTLFQKRPEKTPFIFDETLIDALAGLGSALDRVHEFLDERLNLSLVGCYHNFRPRNIFISEEKLILTDFGLSLFKGEGEDPKLDYEHGVDLYLAPECVDHDNKLKPQNLSRPSDIWSFGCILLEFMIYLVFGPEGVKQFADERAFKMNQLTIGYFHCGTKPNPCVEDWLSKFDITGSRCYRGVIALAKRMISISEILRPTAKEVTANLRFMLILELTEQADETLKHRITENPSFETFVELTRFEAWKYAFGIVDHNGDFTTVWPTTLSDEAFNLTSDYLDKLKV